MTAIILQTGNARERMKAAWSAACRVVSVATSAVRRVASAVISVMFLARVSD